MPQLALFLFMPLIFHVPMKIFAIASFDYFISLAKDWLLSSSGYQFPNGQFKVGDANAIIFEWMEIDTSLPYILR